MLLLLPPLAFARIGRSGTPVDAFTWGPNDHAIAGTGKTTVVRNDGRNAAIVFRDETGIRPVAPYFELYDGDEPVTPETVKPGDVTWTIRLANLKAFYRTGKEGDKISGSRRVRADRPGRTTVRGRSPDGGKPLVPREAPIDFGDIEVLAPERGQPYRVRFWPPKGLVYGPRNIARRKPELSNIVATLNPGAAWCHWQAEPNNFLGKLSLFDDEERSAGLVDDTSDGFIEARLRDGRTARARLAITPPYYAPDRRYVTTIADGLKDREDRDEPQPEGGEAEELVLDILERALETLGNMNLEALVERYEAGENPNYAYSTDKPWYKGASGIFDVERLQHETLERFPLTEAGLRKHRQLVSVDLLKRFIRQRPGLLEEILRPPAGDDQYFNRQMPPLQRGSDARPLHVTRRQYEMLIAWAKTVCCE